MEKPEFIPIYNAVSTHEGDRMEIERILRKRAGGVPN